MKVTEEFKIKSAKGNTLTLQNLIQGITYLDYGKTHLPRTFEGYRVKDTDRTAEAQADGSFKISDSTDPYTRA